MRILSAAVTFLASCTLAITGGFSAVMWFAGVSAVAGLIAICCAALLIVLAIGVAIAVGRHPGADPWAGTEFERGPEYKRDLAVPATEDPAEWTGPIARGGTRIERRLRSLLHGQGRLLRTASVARHRRARAGVQVTPPEPAPVLEPVRLPLPPPITIPDSLPPAAFTEPEPDSLYRPDSTIWTTTAALYGGGTR